MTDDSPPPEPGAPHAEEIRHALGLIPLIEAHARRCGLDMPADLQSAFDDHRLTARHRAVLAQLVAVSEAGVGELARRMSVSLPTASELVGDLRRAGVVESRPDPDNRRRTLVGLSEDYRPSVEALSAARSAPLLRVLQDLSPGDQRGFLAGLSAWAAELQKE